MERLQQMKLAKPFKTVLNGKNPKRVASLLGVISFTLVMGVVIGAILYSNTIDQQIDVIDYDQAITVVVVDDLSAGTFRDILQTTAFNLTKNVENGLNSFEFNIIVDHATEALVIADVTVGVRCYYTYLGATPYYETTMIETRSFGTGNGEHYFTDAIGLNGASMYCYYELDITFNTGAPSGAYTISVFADDGT